MSKVKRSKRRIRELYPLILRNPTPKTTLSLPMFIVCDTKRDKIVIYSSAAMQIAPTAVLQFYAYATPCHAKDWFRFAVIVGI